MAKKGTPEYEEGKAAREKFEQGMEALFQVPKSAVLVKKKARKKRAIWGRGGTAL